MSKLHNITQKPINMSLPVNIHTHRLSAEQVIQILSCDYQSFEPKPVFPAGGPTFRSLAFHPMKWLAGDTISGAEAEALLQVSDVIAIGESGLDKNAAIPVEEQMELFRQQEELSIRHQFPIIIHCVGRWNELERLFKMKKADSPAWIIHGFRKTKLAERFLELGAYLSFGHALLYDEQLQQLAVSAPFERIFLETDDSDVGILALYEKLAELKSLSLPAVTDQLFSNYRTVFHHGKLA